MRLGWLPDLPDSRDYDQGHPTVVAPRAAAVSQPSVRPQLVDLRQYCSPIEDQGDTSSCTAHAGVALMEWFQRRVYGKHLDMSRRFLYKTARRLAGIKNDEGCYLRSTMQAMVTFGTPPERDFPFDEKNLNQEPDAFTYGLAEKFEAYSYYRLVPTAGKSQVDVLLDTLAGGLPFMFGFTVYSSITNDGWIPEPRKGDRVTGGHAVVAVGYDLTKKALLIRNSWGTKWGHNGYGWLPLSYIERGSADDYWSLVKANFVDLDVFK